MKTETTDASGGGAHVNALDGVRAIAILLVMLTHAGAPLFEAGWIGVDLFFALSGFLITTLLLQEFQRYQAISYRNFLVRRTLRLTPAYLIYVALMTYGIWGWAGSVTSYGTGWGPAAYTMSLWTYTVNFAPKGGIWNGQDATVHLWSLAVEQQYYLFWPLIVMALARRPKRLILAGAILTVAALSIFVARGGDASMLYARGFTLGLSSTCAVAAFHYRESLQRFDWRGVGLVGGLSVLLAFGLSTAKIWTNDQVTAYLLPPMSVAFVLWTIALWYKPVPRLVRPLLLNSPMLYIGKISYGVYLWHELCRVAVWHYFKPLMLDWPSSVGYVARLGLYIGLSFAVAALSYELIELKFLKLRGRFRRPEPGAANVAAGTSAS